MFSLSSWVVFLKLKYMKKIPIERGMNILNILIINFNPGKYLLLNLYPMLN